jgi:hypothetical protein
MTSRLLLVVMLAGCTAHKPPARRINWTVPPDCITAPIKMTDCDGEMAHCKKVEIKVRKSCAATLDIQPN